MVMTGGMDRERLGGQILVMFVNRCILLNVGDTFPGLKANFCILGHCESLGKAQKRALPSTIPDIKVVSVCRMSQTFLGRVIR